MCSSHSELGLPVIIPANILLFFLFLNRQHGDRAYSMLGKSTE